MMLIYSLMGPHRQSKYEDISFEYLLYLAGFLKTWLNGDCCENFHRGRAILVGVIVKFRPWANCPWSGNRLPCEFLGAGERVLRKYATVRLSGEWSHWSCVWVKFIMPSSLKGPGWLAKERIRCTDVLCCNAFSGRGRRSGGGGSGVMSALNSLLMASLSLKLPQSWL